MHINSQSFDGVMLGSLFEDLDLEFCGFLACEMFSGGQECGYYVCSGVNRCCATECCYSNVWRWVRMINAEIGE